MLSRSPGLQPSRKACASTLRKGVPGVKSTARDCSAGISGTEAGGAFGAASVDREDWGKAASGARGFCGTAAGGEDILDTNEGRGDFKASAPAAAAFLSRAC